MLGRRSESLSLCIRFLVSMYVCCSDGTLNPSGVRFGSAEIYNIGIYLVSVCVCVCLCVCVCVCVSVSGSYIYTISLASGAYGCGSRRQFVCGTAIQR